MRRCLEFYITQDYTNLPPHLPIFQSLHTHTHTRKLKIQNSPFSNPIETYQYYSFPYCRRHHENTNTNDGSKTDETPIGGVPIRSRSSSLSSFFNDFASALVGDRYETSPYDITFRKDINHEVLCRVSLSYQDLEKYRYAIQNNYFIEMYLNDLPMWNYVGDYHDNFNDVRNDDNVLLTLVEEESYGSKTTKTQNAARTITLYPHLHFYLGYHTKLDTKNGNRINQIVAAKLTTDVRMYICLCVCMYMSGLRMMCVLCLVFLFWSYAFSISES